MSTGNLVIRLIDIVFLLLFGFIAVSQVDSGAAIEPPKSTEANSAAPDGAEIVIIGVTEEGTYPVDNGYRIIKTQGELRAYLVEKERQASSRNARLGVRIRANWDAPVEYGLAVARLCRDLNLPKGLDVVRVDFSD